MKKINTVILTIGCIASSMTAVNAQTSSTNTTSSTTTVKKHGIGSETKTVFKDLGKGAKKVGSEIEKGGKDVVKGSEKGAEVVGSDTKKGFSKLTGHSGSKKAPVSATPDSPGAGR